MKDMHSYPGPDMFPVMHDRVVRAGRVWRAGPADGGPPVVEQAQLGIPQTFEDRAKLQAGYEALIEKLEPLVKQGLAAAIYTQTTDVEGEINGLMTYDRKVVKFDAAKLAELHRRLIGLVTR